MEFSRQIFGKYSNIKFHKKPSSGSRIFPCGRRQTDRHDKANSRVSQFCKSSYNVLLYVGCELAEVIVCVWQNICALSISVH
jgi:hypothetical protein